MITLEAKSSTFLGYLMNSVFKEKFNYQEREAMGEFIKSDDPDTNLMAAVMISKMLEDRASKVSKSVFNYIEHALKNKNN